MNPVINYDELGTSKNYINSYGNKQTYPITWNTDHKYSLGITYFRADNESTVIER